MARATQGGAYEARGAIFLRVTIATGQRRAERMSWVTAAEWTAHDAKAAPCPCVACIRGRDVQTLVNRYRAGGADDEMVEALVKSGATASAEKLAAISRAVDGFCEGKIPKAKKSLGGVLTFADFADKWTSGELHRDYPDHVPLKKSSNEDAWRFAKYVAPVVTDLPLAEFTLRHAQAVLRSVPRERSTSTRRQVAQLMVRLCNLAVYPCELIERSPLPKGFLPRVKCRVGAHLYPAEDRALLAACGSEEKPGVPLAHRFLYGLLAREGMRKEEALALTWSDLDLERGALRLDRNKTDDPRAWALDPSVAAAFRWWRENRAKGAPNDARIFVDVEDGARLAEALRDHLTLAGVDRPELFEHDDVRRRVNVHSLRATFVTMALANGKSEAWVQDRTGHRSSSMVNRYRRVARTVAELGLGALAPLDRAIPEMRKPAAAKRLRETAASTKASGEARQLN